MPLPITSKIESLGICLPEKRVTTEELLAACRHRPRWDLERITGIRERRVAPEGQYALDLGIAAARQALALSNHAPQDIDLVLCTSISKYNRPETVVFEPASSALLIRALGLTGARNFDLVNACAGMISGLRMADAYIRTGRARCALIVSGEFNTPLGQTAQRQMRHSFDGQLAALTLGDCGAAYLLDGSDSAQVGFHCFDIASGARHNHFCWSRPSPRGPGGMLITKARDFQRTGNANFPRYTKRILARTGWTLSDVDVGIPHQVSVRAIKNSKRALDRFFGCDVGLERFASISDRYGNTTTTSHALALHDQILGNRLNDGARLLFISGASGIVISHATYTMDDLPSRYRAFASARPAEAAFPETPDADGHSSAPAISAEARPKGRSEP